MSVTIASMALGQSFTVDPGSVGLPGTGVNALAPAPEHIFNNVFPPGPVPPGIGFSGNNFIDVFDPDSPDRDALSAGFDPLDADELWDLMFSVDRDGIGLPGTGLHSRSLGGHAVGADYYFANPHLGVGMNALMTISDVHHGLSNGPASNQEVSDNIDGAEIWDSRAGVEIPYEGFSFVGDSVYDSINGIGAGPADIRKDGAVLFIAADLGLTDADNIDALAMDIGFEQSGVGDNVVEALFSLAPGSKSLFGPDGVERTADDLSPADIFYTDFSGQFDIAGPTGLLGVFPNNLNFPFDLTAANLGLNFFPEEDVDNDNIDAIDIISTMTIYDFPEDPPQDPGEPLIPPPPDQITGDLNGDGFVGIADLNIILSDWNKTVPPANPLADPSGDAFVGIADLNIVLGNWNAGTPPAHGTVPEPTALGLVILGSAALLRRSETSR